MRTYDGAGACLVRFKEPTKLPCRRLLCWQLKDASDGSPLEQLAAMAEEDYDPEVWNYHCIEHDTTFNVAEDCPGDEVKLPAGCIAPVSSGVASILIQHDVAELTSVTEVVKALIKSKASVVINVR